MRLVLLRTVLLLFFACTHYAAKYLRKLARDALDVGPDVTAYMLSYTARSFVPYYAQRISHAIVMHGAAGVHKGITRMQCARLRHASAA